MKILSFISMFIFSVPVLSQVCTNTYTPQSLYQEGINQNIHLILKNLEIESIDGLIRDAQKMINPELEHFTTAGNQFGDRNVTSESRIWFNVQLGNKRSKRSRVFETDKAIGQAELELLKLTFQKEIFLGILRYKQINRELAFLDSLDQSVEKLSEKYKKLSYLTPEQQIEFGTLNISGKDLDFRRASLENESLLIRRFFQRILDEKCEVNISLHPKLARNDWPNLKGLHYQEDQSINARIEKLMVQKSQFVFERENAHKYPDLKIGPVWQLNKLANKEYNIFGVGFILPLPFERNQGLRATAQINLERERRTQEFNKQQRAKEFNFRLTSYLRLREKILADKEIDQYSKMTSDFNRLFRRGLISTSSFLNFKREILNLAVQVHSIESSLATHLMELYRINDAPTDDLVTKVLKL